MHRDSAPFARTGRPALIVLGASNAARGIATITALAQAALGPECDLVCAIGAGRAYATASRVLGRGLGAIRDSALWQAVRSGGAGVGARYLVVSDLGNDVGYGAPVFEVARAVTSCLDRLAIPPPRTVLVPPPAALLERLPAWQFQLARRVLFPAHHIERAEVVARLHELAAWVREEGARRGAVVVAPRSSWYGFDPIHVRRAMRLSAWREILSPLLGNACAAAAAPPWWRSAHLRSGRAASLTLLGRELRTEQPCRRANGATRISYF